MVPSGDGVAPAAPRGLGLNSRQTGAWSFTHSFHLLRTRYEDPRRGHARAAVAKTPDADGPCHRPSERPRMGDPAG